MLIKLVTPIDAIGPDLSLVCLAAKDLYPIIARLFRDRQSARRTWVEVQHTLIALGHRVIGDDRDYERFRVTCDETTNPPDVVDQGRVRFTLAVAANGASFFGGLFALRYLESGVLELDYKPWKN